MATRGAIFEARRQRLLQIESKVRSWWEERGVSKRQIPYMKILTEINCRPYWPWRFEFNDEMRRKSTINFPSPGEAIRVYSADATLLTIASHSADSVAARHLEATLFFKVSRLVKEIEWMEEYLQAKLDDQSSLIKGSLTTFPERVFENQINVAIKQTERYYLKPLEFPKPCFQSLQDARELYIFLCSGGGAARGAMNRELILHYMDVQTVLINIFCPHYADYVWREVLKKDGTIHDARWPSAASADFKLSAATEYLHKLMRMINEDETITEDQKKAISCLIYVKEEQLEHEPQSQEIKGVNKSSTLSDMQAFHIGNSTSPSASWETEREIMEQNLDFIKKLFGFQDGEVLSSTQLREAAKLFVQEANLLRV